MRRRSFHRPYAKVRNPARHLRSLRKWANKFEGWFPESDGTKYWHHKIPVLDRLVDPPRAQLEWQAQALDSLFVVARHLLATKPKNMTGRAWVAVMATYPAMWSSEVTVFYDRDYYLSFLNHTRPITDHTLSGILGVNVPEGLVESGGIVIYPPDPDDEDP